MKKFKQLFESVGSPAVDSKEKKDDEEEVKGYKPRSKGEEDFANMHTVDKKDHPVASPDQHTGDRKGPKSDAGEDHEGNEKKGEELPMTYSQFMKMGGFGQSSARASDKSQGDIKPVMQGSSKVSEEVELDEAVKAGNVKLKSGESVMLSKDDAAALSKAMQGLNSSNKKKMQDELMKDKKSFMSMVKFAKIAA